MKIIKISLIIAVLGLISFFVIKSFGGSPEIEEVAPKNNPFTERIEKDIDNLSKLPESQFCKEKYSEIKYYIDDYYKDQLLGKNKLENSQWKNILSKNLYSVYNAKFIKQVYYVFNKTEWKVQDLNFIRSEYKILRKSEFLEKGSPVDISYSNIEQVLTKYDEITNFIASCRAFSYSDYSLSSSFPMDTAKEKISRLSSYKKNSLENKYVNNCAKLHTQLNEITQYLFDAHYKYLEKKFKNWEGLYSQYNSFNEYRDALYLPLKNELNLLDNELYRVTDFSYRYNKLLNILENDSRNAYNEL